MSNLTCVYIIRHENDLILEHGNDDTQDNVTETTTTTTEGNSKFYHPSGSNFVKSQSHSHSTKYTSDDESSSITSGSGKHPGGTQVAAAVNTSVGNSSSSPVKHVAGNQTVPTSLAHASTSDSAPNAMQIDLEPVIVELRDRREEVSRLSDEVEAVKSQLQTECTVFHQSLQDERYRFEV